MKKENCPSHHHLQGKNPIFSINFKKIVHIFLHSILLLLPQPLIHHLLPQPYHLHVKNMRVNGYKINVRYKFL